MIYCYSAFLDIIWYCGSICKFCFRQEFFLIKYLHSIRSIATLQVRVHNKLVSFFLAPVVFWRGGLFRVPHFTDVFVSWEYWSPQEKRQSLREASNTHRMKGSGQSAWSQQKYDTRHYALLNALLHVLVDVVLVRQEQIWIGKLLFGTWNKHCHECGPKCVKAILGDT